MQLIAFEMEPKAQPFLTVTHVTQIKHDVFTGPLFGVGVLTMYPT